MASVLFKVISQMYWSIKLQKMRENEKILLIYIFIHAMQVFREVEISSTAFFYIDPTGMNSALLK